MKKLITFILPIVIGFLLQSCTFNTVTHFHKNKTTSILADLDVTELMKTVKSMNIDSLKDNKELRLDDLPRTWQSAYEFEKVKNKLPKDPDSIKLMKKFFMKGNFNQDNDFIGFSLKIDHATNKEMAGFYNTLQADKITKILSKPAYTNWDGKKLEIIVENFNISKGQSDVPSDSKNPMDAIPGMMDIISIKFKNTLVFDSKIKSIEGKHDWIKQIDDRTVVIEYDSKDTTNNEYPFVNNDPKIIINLK